MLYDSPTGRLAMQRIVAASADIEAQLSVLSGTRPVLIMLVMARQEAAVALEQLACLEHADEASLPEIRRLLMEVRRFEDLMRWLRKIVSDGFDYDQEITADDREELLDMLARTPEGQEEAIEIGLAERMEEGT